MINMLVQQFLQPCKEGLLQALDVSKDLNYIYMVHRKDACQVLLVSVQLTAVNRIADLAKFLDPQLMGTLLGSCTCGASLVWDMVKAARPDGLSHRARLIAKCHCPALPCQPRYTVLMYVHHGWVVNLKYHQCSHGGTLPFSLPFP